MRLEIDTTVSAPHPAKDAEPQTNVDSTELRSALSQGIKAAQAGDRAQARTSLLKVTELDPRNENAWLWLASISEYPEELLGFLNHVLAVNPENQRAGEWKIATHALLSRTFVQRGIDASQENQNEFATQCFRTALEYNDQNALAWTWLASLSDSNTVKISLLEKALEIEPGNEVVAAAIDGARANILKERLAEAKSAAVAGNHQEAINVLDSLLEVNPNSVEAWTMRSHLAEGFDEKIRCFEHILAIEPDNVAAKAGKDSLLSIFGTVEPAHAESPESVNNIRQEAAPSYVQYLDVPSADKSPTEELEMPAGFAGPDENVFEEQIENKPEQIYENEKPEIIAEPFATFAEETPDPDETATVSSDDLTVVNNFDASDAVPVDEVLSEPVAVHSDEPNESAEINYDLSSDAWQTEAAYDTDVADEWSDPYSEPSISIPPDALPPNEASSYPDVPETFVEAAEVIPVKAESVECPFCNETNDPQVISCQSCMAVLTLSDLELLLGNQTSNTLVLRQAVEDMERKRLSGDFGTADFVTLGLGHLNLRNFQTGYSCLQEASKLSPNNVVLSGQVNALLIRLEEIKKQEEVQLKMPKGKSILVVDDSPTVRKLISGKLEKSGHTVMCANDGVEAMERLNHFVPDLVLLDIAMPRMDGYQVCKQIRSNEATRDVTVVMISGKDGFFDKVRGRMAGTTGYITKPFGPETLMKAVEMYLSGAAPEMDEA
ncbi:MAG TPA: response regulator [Pyrinomonadaceae bacterium]|nr:response regulator [Pyrinomonadaceae bacterium]